MSGWSRHHSWAPASWWRSSPCTWRCSPRTERRRAPVRSSRRITEAGLTRFDMAVAHNEVARFDRAELRAAVRRPRDLRPVDAGVVVERAVGPVGPEERYLAGQPQVLDHPVAPADELLGIE